MSLTGDLPQAIPVLQDWDTLAGVPINKVVEGDAAAGMNSIPSMVGKDPSGKLQFIRLSTNHEVITKNDSSEIAYLSDEGKVTGNKTTAQTVATIPLQTETEYRKLGWIVSCFRQAEFQIIQVNDAIQTVLATILVGPSQYTAPGELEGITFTSGATGTQSLIIKGLNFEAESDLRGTLAITEVQADIIIP